MCIYLLHLTVKFFLNFLVADLSFFFLVKPNNTTLKSVPDIAIVTESVQITCKAKGLPEPTYVIYHNGTKLTDKGEITIDLLKYSHAGEYRCNATNKLGMDSDSYFLKVKGKICGDRFIPISCWHGNIVFFT